MTHEKANDTNRVLPKRGVLQIEEENRILPEERAEGPGGPPEKVRRTTPRNDLSAEYVRSLLNYYPDTGEFEWKVRRSGVAKCGRFRGSIGTKSSLILSIDGVTYKAHRLAWLYMMGVWPKNQIDHINRDASDNRFDNLREATNQENHFNQLQQSNNKSGFSGIWWHPSSKRWHASIKIDGVKKHLGCFQDKQDAISARKVAETEHFGNFAPC